MFQAPAIEAGESRVGSDIDPIQAGIEPSVEILLFPVVLVEPVIACSRCLIGAREKRRVGAPGSSVTE